MERGLGYVEIELLIGLAPGRKLQRKPDVSFISYDRWPRGKRIPRTTAWHVVPDLAIEVVSPTDPAVDLVTKIGGYLRAGVRRVLVVFPAACQVYDYESPREIRVLERGDVLDGGAILPGFRLPLRDVFEDEEVEAPAPDVPAAAESASRRRCPQEGRARTPRPSVRMGEGRARGSRGGS